MDEKIACSIHRNEPGEIAHGYETQRETPEGNFLKKQLFDGSETYELGLGSLHGSTVDL